MNMHGYSSAHVWLFFCWNHTNKQKKYYDCRFWFRYTEQTHTDHIKPTEIQIFIHIKSAIRKWASFTIYTYKFDIKTNDIPYGRQTNIDTNQQSIFVYTVDLWFQQTSIICTFSRFLVRMPLVFRWCLCMCEQEMIKIFIRMRFACSKHWHATNTQVANSNSMGRTRIVCDSGEIETLSI